MVGRHNVIRGVRNSRIQIEVMRASTYSTYDIGKRYGTSRDGRGLVSIFSVGTSSCHVNRRIVVCNAASVKVRTMLLTFNVPFLMLLVALFVSVHLAKKGRLESTLITLSTLLPCCLVVCMYEGGLDGGFSFALRPVGGGWWVAGWGL